MKYGADSDQLEDFARKLDASADELSGLLAQGVGSVALASLGTTIATIWRGPRSADFSGLWQGTHLVRLVGLQSMLKDAAATARSNADEQRRASAVGFGGGLFPDSGPFLPSDRLRPPWGGPGSSNPRFPGEPWFPVHPVYRWPSGPLPDFEIYPWNPPDWDDFLDPGEIRYGDHIVVDENGLAVAGEVGRHYETSYGAEGSFELGPVSGKGSVGGHVSAGMHASGSASLGPDGLEAEFDAAVGVEAEVNAEGSVAMGPMTATAAATAGVYASAGASGNLGITKDGVAAHASVSAYAGARARAEGSAEVFGVEATGGAEAWAGIGFEADVEAKITAEEISIDVDLGAAIGLGGKVDFEVSVSPAELISDTSDVAGDLWDGATSLVSSWSPW